MDFSGWLFLTTISILGVFPAFEQAEDCEATRKFGCHCDLLPSDNFTVTCRDVQEVPLGLLPTRTEEFTWLGAEFLMLEDVGIPSFPSLRKLTIAMSKVSRINKWVFRSLKKLRELYLQQNLLRMILPGAFSGLNELRTLNLSGNKIFYLHPNTFTSLRSLETLDLSNNLLMNLPPELFTRLSLSLIGLHNNPLTCDCRLSWLPGYLFQQKVDLLQETQCAYPQSLNNTLIKKDDRGQTPCEDGGLLSVPFLDLAPSHNRLLFAGDPVHVRCTAPYQFNSSMAWIINGNVMNKRVAPPSLHVTTRWPHRYSSGSMLIDHELKMTSTSDLVHGEVMCRLSVSRMSARRSVLLYVMGSGKTSTCPAEVAVTLQGVLYWPPKLPDTKVFRACPFGSNEPDGFASRACSADGIWDEADLSACKFRNKLINLLLQLSKASQTYSYVNSLVMKITSAVSSGISIDSESEALLLGQLIPVLTEKIGVLNLIPELFLKLLDVLLESPFVRGVSSHAWLQVFNKVLDTLGNLPVSDSHTYSSKTVSVLSVRLPIGSANDVHVVCSLVADQNSLLFSERIACTPGNSSLNTADVLFEVRRSDMDSVAMSESTRLLVVVLASDAPFQSSPRQCLTGLCSQPVTFIVGTALRRPESSSGRSDQLNIPIFISLRHRKLGRNYNPATWHRDDFRSNRSYWGDPDCYLSEGRLKFSRLSCGTQGGRVRFTSILAEGPWKDPRDVVSSRPLLSLVIVSSALNVMMSVLNIIFTLLNRPVRLQRWNMGMLLNTCLCQMVFVGLVPLGTLVVPHQSACVLSGLALVYFMFGGLTWLGCGLLVLRLQIQQRTELKQTRWHVALYISGWGIPGLLTVPTMVKRDSVLNLQDHCFLNAHNSLYAVLVPGLLIFLADIFLAVRLQQAILNAFPASPGTDDPSASASVLNSALDTVHSPNRTSEPVLVPDLRSGSGCISRRYLTFQQKVHLALILVLCVSSTLCVVMLSEGEQGENKDHFPQLSGYLYALVMQPLASLLLHVSCWKSLGGSYTPLSKARRVWSLVLRSLRGRFDAAKTNPKVLDRNAKLDAQLSSQVRSLSTCSSASNMGPEFSAEVAGLGPPPSVALLRPLRPNFPDVVPISAEYSTDTTKVVSANSTTTQQHTSTSSGGPHAMSEGTSLSSHDAGRTVSSASSPPTHFNPATVFKAAPATKGGLGDSNARNVRPHMQNQTVIVDDSPIRPTLRPLAVPSGENLYHPPIRFDDGWGAARARPCFRPRMPPAQGFPGASNPGRPSFRGPFAPLPPVGQSYWIPSSGFGPIRMHRPSSTSTPTMFRAILPPQTSVEPVGDRSQHSMPPVVRPIPVRPKPGCVAAPSTEGDLAQKQTTSVAISTPSITQPSSASDATPVRRVRTRRPKSEQPFSAIAYTPAVVYIRLPLEAEAEDSVPRETAV